MTTVSQESLVIDMKRISLVLSCLALIAAFLVSCSSGGMVTMEYNEEGILVADNGREYYYAPVGYEPTSQGDEYGEIDGVLSEKLYCIGDIDPKKWITTEYSGATTTVFYSTDIQLPELSELEPDTAFICEQDENVYSVYTLGDPENDKVDEERAIIAKIIEMLCDESIESEIWPRATTTEVYDIKLYSEDWPAIYYNLEYSREGSGNYVYDRVSKRCINIGDLLEGYFEE